MIDASETLTAALADFGTAATIDWTATTVVGIYSATVQDFDQDGRAIEVDQPNFDVPAAAAAGLVNNDTVLTIDAGDGIGPIDYQIHARGPAIDGAVRLLLTRDF